MASQLVKAAVLGDPELSLNIGYALVLICDLREISLIDPHARIRAGHALDLMICGAGLKRSIDVELSSSLEAARDSQLVIWAFDFGYGFKLHPGILNSMLDQIKQYIPELIQLCPESIFLVASYPSDLLVYLIWRISGMARARILGIESTHSSLLLTQLIRARIGAYRDGLMLGFNPEFGFPLKSYLDTPVDWSGLARDLVRGSSELAETGAKFSRAICVGMLTRAISEDLKQEFGVSAILEGEYGLRDLALGVPALIGAGGVELILEYQLDEQESEALKAAANSFRELISKLRF